jgi:hypothetical protein
MRVSRWRTGIIWTRCSSSAWARLVFAPFAQPVDAVDEAAVRLLLAGG